MDYVAPFVEPLRHKTFHFTRAWMQAAGGQDERPVERSESKMARSLEPAAVVPDDPPGDVRLDRRALPIGRDGAVPGDRRTLAAGVRRPGRGRPSVRRGSPPLLVDSSASMARRFSRAHAPQTQRLRAVGRARTSRCGRGSAAWAAQARRLGGAARSPLVPDAAPGESVGSEARRTPMAWTREAVAGSGRRTAGQAVAARTLPAAYGSPCARALRRRRSRRISIGPVPSCAFGPEPDLLWYDDIRRCPADARMVRRVVPHETVLWLRGRERSRPVGCDGASCAVDACDGQRSRCHAATFRGRPRGRFRAMTTPWSKISPPQTPQGSPRSSAPARQAARAGQSAQSTLAFPARPAVRRRTGPGLPLWQGRSSENIGSIAGFEQQADHWSHLRVVDDVVSETGRPRTELGSRVLGPGKHDRPRIPPR